MARRAKPSRGFQTLRASIAPQDKGAPATAPRHRTAHRAACAHAHRGRPVRSSGAKDAAGGRGEQDAALHVASGRSSGAASVRRGRRERQRVRPALLHSRRLSPATQSSSTACVQARSAAAQQTTQSDTAHLQASLGWLQRGATDGCTSAQQQRPGRWQAARLHASAAGSARSSSGRAATLLLATAVAQPTRMSCAPVDRTCRVSERRPRQLPPARPARSNAARKKQ